MSNESKTARPQHAPEPWVMVEEIGYGHRVGWDIKGLHLIDEDGQGLLVEADAARIVACVNACAGLNPKAIPALVAAAVAGMELIESKYHMTCSEVRSGKVLGDVAVAYATLRAALAAVKGGFPLGDTASGGSQDLEAAMSKPGAALALLLLADALAEPQSTLSEAREAFDNGERRGSYIIEHDPMCPAAPGVVKGPRHCACGLATMLERVRDSHAEIERIRHELSRIATEVER